MPDSGFSPKLRGTCIVMFAVDVGFAIDLDKAEQYLSHTAQRENIRRRRRSPAYFAYRPPPLRLFQSGNSELLEGRTVSAVEVVLYDFGAASVGYHVPFDEPLDEMPRLAEQIYDHPGLFNDAHTRVRQLLQVLGESVDRPRLGTGMEDYVVYRVDSIDDEADAGCTGPQTDRLEFARRHTRGIAQVLRAETQPLSDQQAAEALLSQWSYRPGEVSIIDWNASMVLERECEDVVAALEFANVELLELRHLDEQLDDTLDGAYASVSRRQGLFKRMANMRRLGRLQVDAALLFEGVNNSLKLLGDQYLARIYHAASERFHIPEWDASILRKLETIESIYQKLDDRQTTVRMEVLEWIIILLIAFEVVMSLRTPA